MARQGRKDPQPKFPASVERARAAKYPLHFVLRASGGPGSIDTREMHDQVMRDLGSVWIGKWGASVGEWPIEIATEQIASGTPTFLYLRTSPRQTYKANLVGLARAGLAPDVERVPEYYRDERCGLWFLLDRWLDLDDDELDQLRNYVDPRARPVYARQGGIFFVTLR